MATITSNRTVQSNLSIFNQTANVGIDILPDTSNPYVPKRIDSYVFDRSLLRDTLFVLNNSDQDMGLWFAGPKGCGKTTCIKQVANRMNYPMITIQGHERLEIEDLVGFNKIINGQFQFVPGPLTIAMEQGTLFTLDEADQCPPSVTVCLHDILEGEPLLLSSDGSRIVQPHPDFRLFATGNSNGLGDMSGQYGGVLVQNTAYMDRFIVANVDYVDPQIEAAIIKGKYPGLTDEITERMVDYANTVRSLFTGNFKQPTKYTDVQIDGSTQISSTLSTRGVMHWAKLANAFKNAPNPMMYGLERVLINKAESAERIALTQLAKAMLEGAKK